MNRYYARQLLALPMDELRALPEESHVILFDDGELITHTRATIMSTIAQHPLTHFPECPVVKDYHFGDMMFTSKNVVKLLNRIFWGIHSWTGETVDPEWLSKLTEEANNRIYNFVSGKLGAWVTTMSLFDAMEVAEHPEIRRIKENLELTQYGIEKVAYAEAAQVFRDPTQLRGNPIAEGYRLGTQKMEQINQCFVSRGFGADYNEGIFPEPIEPAFFDGIWGLYEQMIESRSGTKALAYNKELLRITEYFNRKTQLIAEYVQRLHHGDCGTPHWVEFPVLENLLPRMKGKYYLRADGTEDWLRGDEKHLIGTKIRMRSVLSCIHPDPAGICSKCYGRLSYSVPHGTNIGQVSAVITGDKVTSSVLSTKHTDSTSIIDKFQLHKVEAKYLRYGSQEETLYLRKEHKGRRMRLLVERGEAQSLADVLMIRDLSAYPVTNATNLSKVAIHTDTPSGVTSDILNVSLYNRKSSFSREFLEYIQKTRWTHDNRDNIVIDLSGFDVSKPFFVLPYKHVNMYEVMKRIQSFLHSGSESDGGKLSTDKSTNVNKTYLRNYKDPVEALAVFAAMVNEKLSVNIVHCEILLYAMMARSPINRDYRLPIPGISGVFEKYNRLMLNRSLSAAMAFEKQHEPMVNPGSFLFPDRNDHPYDAILLGGKLQ